MYITIPTTRLRRLKNLPRRRARNLQVGGSFASLARAAAPILRGPARPPALRQVTGISRTLRYYCSQDVAGQSYGVDDLLDAWFVATSATAGNRLLCAARLLRVSLWGPAHAPTGSTAGTISLNWNEQSTGAFDDFGAPGVPITDQSMAITDVPCIHTKPPAKSPAAQWQSGPTSIVNFFGITCPAGSVLDITFEGIVIGGPGGQTTSGFVPVVRTVSGATAGQIYWSSIPNFYPIEATTI